MGDPELHLCTGVLIHLANVIITIHLIILFNLAENTYLRLVLSVN